MKRTELNPAERRTIEDLLYRKINVSEIARRINRHRATVYPEIERNVFNDEELPQLSGYYGMTTQRSAGERRARRRKLVRIPALRDVVIDRLQEGSLSSLQAAIAGQRDHPSKSPAAESLKAMQHPSATRLFMPTFTAQMASLRPWHDICQTAVKRGNHVMLVALVA